MSRTLVNIYRLVSLLAGLACLLVVPAWSVPLVATPQATPTRVFKVCLLLMESQRNSTATAKYWNPDPWILPVLNRSPYKPTGWILDNPLAPGILPVDGELETSGARYAQDGKGNGHNWYTNDTKTPGVSPLTKDDPAYWVVKLDQKSIDALAKFDLVIVNGHSRSTLSNADRDNLQLLLNRGATIWLNNSQREGNQLNNFFLDPPIVLHNGPYTDTNNNVQLVCVDWESWLMSGYYRLTDYDVRNLRDNRSENSYIVSGFGGLIGEVVRLYSKNLMYPNGGKPVIAAGRVGAGQLIVTATDVVGGTADWWEYQHNHDTANVWGMSTLGIPPYFQSAQTGNPNQAASYVACNKFFFNMLSRPSSWHMVGGNVLASRFFPQAFSTSLLRSWTTPFTALNDPVAFGNYLAVTGQYDGVSQLRIYRVNSASATRSLDLRHVIPPPSTGYSWVGSPVFGRVIVTDSTTPITVVYALEGYYNADTETWLLRPRCFALSTGDERWASPPTLGVLCPQNAIPSASMTLSNNRLVVTTFGKTVNNAGSRIFILDATTGAMGATVGAVPGWGPNFRLTGPASIITAPIDIQIAPSESGDMRITGSGGIERRKEMVELLAVTGEAYPALTGYPCLYLIPPIAVGKTTNPQQAANVTTVNNPSTLFLQGGGGGTKYPIGIANSSSDPTQLRRRNIVAIMTRGDTIKILFRNFDIFVSQGTLAAKLPAASGKQLTITYPVVTSMGTTQDVNLHVPTLAMGYPILLHGTKQYPLDNRLSLRKTDGDGAGTFGYAVDAPPIIRGDQVIVSSNCTQQQGRPFLQRARVQALGEGAIVTSSDPRLSVDLHIGGSLTAYRIASSELTQFGVPSGNRAGDIAWHFFGDNFGPKGTGQTALDADNLPVLWRSDFPYPAAAGADAIYAIGAYNNAYSGALTGEKSAPLAGNAVHMLYALDPAPSRYLRQVVTAGTGVQRVAGNAYQLTMNQAVVGPLRVGARAILKFGSGAWDMGTVLLIRGTVNGDTVGDPFTVTFDRPTPPDTLWNGGGASLLVATSNPYVSHVQGWDQVTGAKPITTYNRNGTMMSRVSQGICSTIETESQRVNPFEKMYGEMLVSFTQLQRTCHEPNTYNGATATPNDTAFPPADWATYSHLFLPRLGAGGLPTVTTASSAGGAYTPARTVTNYTIDYRSGRVELSPEMAGQYADRFVVVHYTTMETQGGAMQQVHHAEIMHIPSQVKWQYQFNEDTLPDSGPVLVNDTIYVTANRWVDGKWLPALFAFDARPQDPLWVQPKMMQPVGPTVDGAWGEKPYRTVTSPTPLANGILVGTAFGGNVDRLAYYADRGTLIADGHRVLRINSDGLVTWQASATKDYDLAAQTSPDAATKGAGLVQQDFTMITRIQRLENGNILVCDTGGNRVVEMDRNGTAVWQYPDSDLLENGNPTTPALLRLNGPRDVKRYQRDVISPDGSVTIRWEITLIADTGNSRIIEVCRPTISYTDVGVQGAGFQYRPDLTVGGVKLEQFQEVIADGKTVTFEGKPLAQPLNFTIARRYPSGVIAADDNGLAHANWVLNGVRSKEVLAVIGNPVNDPVLKNASLRTVALARSGATPMVIMPSATPATHGANALLIRKGSPYDFVNTRQLDLITLWNADGDPVLHALVVDHAGVREVPFYNQARPVFEMTQTEYAAALSAPYWSTYRSRLSAANQTKLDQWLANDRLFAPMAVMRIDPGSELTVDQPSVRYLISQMSTLTPMNVNNPTAADFADGARRIHLFEARYIGPPAYNPRSWGIVDANNSFYLYPNPLSPDYPNLPGTTYPLTQPLSIVRD